MTAGSLGLYLLSYLLGSVPFAIIVSRAMRLPDPRGFGSGNPGATNVLRSGSKLGALLTLLGDSGKGALAVGLALALAGVLGVHDRILVAAWCGAFAFLGHVWPIFLGFRGGKGVATFLGTMLAIEPRMGLAACVFWLLVAVVARYSSLASVCAALAGVAAGVVLGVDRDILLPAALMCFVLVARHRQNMARILAGTEGRIGQKSR